MLVVRLPRRTAAALADALADAAVAAGAAAAAAKAEGTATSATSAVREENFILREVWAMRSDKKAELL